MSSYRDPAPFDTPEYPDYRAKGLGQHYFFDWSKLTFELMPDGNICVHQPGKQPKKRDSFHQSGKYGYAMHFQQRNSNVLKQLDLYSPDTYPDIFVYLKKAFPRHPAESWYRIELVEAEKRPGEPPRVGGIVDEVYEFEQRQAKEQVEQLKLVDFRIGSWSYRISVGSAVVVEAARTAPVTLLDAHGEQILFRVQTGFEPGQKVKYSVFSPVDRQHGKAVTVFSNEYCFTSFELIRDWLEWSFDYYAPYFADRRDKVDMRDITWHPWEPRHFVQNAFRFFFEVYYVSHRFQGYPKHSAVEMAGTNATRDTKYILGRILPLHIDRRWRYPRCDQNFSH